MAQTKATKKFEKRHLKDVLKRRRESAKIKQRQQVRAKKKARTAKQDEQGDDGPDTKASKGEKESNADAKSLASMSVDDFFQGGFDIPEKPKQSNKTRKKLSNARDKPAKRKLEDIEDEDEDENEDDSSLEDSVEENPMIPGSSPEPESDDEEGGHREQLDALAKQDPAFYDYLKDNDAELLDFPDDAALAEIDGLSASEEETSQKPKKDRKDVKTKGLDTVSRAAKDTPARGKVTLSLVKRWKLAMSERFSLRSTKEIVLAFRAAAYPSDDDNKKFKYTITSPEVYHELLVTALKHVPEVLQHHLPAKESASGKIRVATESKKYRTLAPILKSYALSLDQLLNNLSDAATLKLTLSSLLSLLPYILSAKKLVRDISRSVAAIWSDAANTEATRIGAFLVLRKLTVIGDAGIREDVLRGTYQGLVKGSRNTTIHTIQGVNLMKNSAAELWGIDATVGYMTGFTFIRQLAIHLRSSITNNSNESYKTVYNWQYVHSLDFWSRVVSSHCDSVREAESGKESPLRPLIYPIVQVTLGAMRLIPTAQYFPLRFQLIRSLLRISRATTTYIPLAPALYEVLTSAEMKKPPKPSTLKHLDFSTSIRAAKSYLRTRVYQDGVGEHVAELLSEFFVLWSKSIAFPELALPVVVMLKRWLKEMSQKSTGNKNGKVNSLIALLVQKLEANSKFIEERRAKVDFAPNDRAGVENFLKEFEWQKTPLGAFVVGQRKALEEKARLIEEGRREEQRKRDEQQQEESQAPKEDGFDDADDESQDLDQMDYEANGEA